MKNGNGEKQLVNFAWNLYGWYLDPGFKNYIEDDLHTPKALKLFLDTVKHPDKINDAKKMMEIFGLRY